jgi:hypothetical protein
MQGELSACKVSLPPPHEGRTFHLFCSVFNAGAVELAKELSNAPVFAPNKDKLSSTTPFSERRKASAPVKFTSDVSELKACDHMLVLLDARTWTSGKDSTQFVEHIHEAYSLGVHLVCIHERPSVVGAPRHACEFAQMVRLHRVSPAQSCRVALC